MIAQRIPVDEFEAPAQSPAVSCVKAYLAAIDRVREAVSARSLNRRSGSNPP